MFCANKVVKPTHIIVISTFVFIISKF
jgi:hypothetical protein